MISLQSLMHYYDDIKSKSESILIAMAMMPSQTHSCIWMQLDDKSSNFCALFTIRSGVWFWVSDRLKRHNTFHMLLSKDA